MNREFDYVTIKYTDQGENYLVCLHAEDARFFDSVASHPSMKNKEGEALVAAYLALSRGDISHVARYKGVGADAATDLSTITSSDSKLGKKNRLTRFMAPGIKEFCGGRMSCGPNGEPAFESFPEPRVNPLVRPGQVPNPPGSTKSRS